MSFTLYNYVLSGNCYKIRLFASLIGVNYQTVNVDFFPGLEHKSEEMLALNPAGTLPVLTTEDQVFTQTAAMLVWMAARFDKSGTWYPTQDPDAMAEVNEWLSFSGSLTATAGEARLHAIINKPLDMEKALAGAQDALRQLELHLCDQRFAGSSWLVGNGPTIADIACFPYVALSPDAGLEHDPYPAIRAWLYAVRSLPGFKTMPGIHELHELKAGETIHG